MHDIYRLETQRLLLREWRGEDYAQFARMNADPEVMRYFPCTLTRKESDALTKKFDDLIAEKGWGFWVAERRTDGAFLGLIGLNDVDDLPIGNALEVGWRLAKAYWGEGYATEAAAASLHFAFAQLKRERVAAFTATQNSPSRKVMARLGMRDRGENFLHPRVPPDSPLQEHVYYEIGRDDFYSNFDESSVSILLAGGQDKLDKPS